MHLAEDLCLLLTPKRTTELPERYGTRRALAAAVVIERALDGDPEVTPETVGELMNAAAPDLHVRVLDRLTAQGALRKSRSWWARVSTASWSRWELRDHERRDALIAVLRRVFRGEVEVDRWTGPLVTLLHEMVELDVVHGEMGERDFSLAEEIAQGKGWAPEAKDLLAACRHAIWHGDT